MASQKDVELILKARLDQGDSLSNAQTIGKGIADTLEAAFDGIGERIADKMMRELQAVLAQANIGLSGSGQTLQLSSNYSPSAPTPGTSILRDPQRKPGSMFEYDGPSGPALTEFHATHYSTDSQFNKAVRDSYYSDHRGESAMGSLSNISDIVLNKRFRSMGVDKNLSQFSNWYKSQQSEIIEADSVVDRFSSYRKAKEMGANVSLDEFGLDKQSIKDARASYGALAGDAAKESSNLATAIAELRNAVVKNTEATEAERRELGDKANVKETLEQHRQDKLKNLVRSKEVVDHEQEILSGRRSDLDEMDKESQTQKFFQKHRNKFAIGAGLLSAGAFVANEYANSNIYQRQAAAGTAALENFGSRMGINEDFGGIWAMGQLGGYDTMRKQAEENVTTRNFASGVAGIAQVGLGAAIGIGSGGLGAVFGGGMALSGLNTLNEVRKRGMFYDRDVASEMGQSLSMFKDQNQERIQAMGKAIGTSLTGYRTSRELGSVSAYGNYMSGTHYAGSDSSGNAKFTEDSFTQEMMNLGLSSDEVMGIKTRMISQQDPMLNGKNLLNRDDIKAQDLVAGQLYRDGGTKVYDLQSMLFQGRSPSGAGNKGDQLHEAKAEANRLMDSLMKDKSITSQQRDLLIDASANAGNGAGSGDRMKNFLTDMMKGGYINQNMTGSQTQSILSAELTRRGMGTSTSGFDGGIKADALEKTIAEAGFDLDSDEQGATIIAGQKGDVTKDYFRVLSLLDEDKKYRESKSYQDYMSKDGATEEGYFASLQESMENKIMEGNKAKGLTYTALNSKQTGAAEKLIEAAQLTDPKTGKLLAIGGDKASGVADGAPIGGDSDPKTPGQIIVQFQNAKDAMLVAEGFKILNEVMPKFGEEIDKIRDNLKKPVDKPTEGKKPADNPNIGTTIKGFQLGWNPDGPLIKGTPRKGK